MVMLMLISCQFAGGGQLVCVCVCVASQAIVGLQLHGGVDMFVFLPSVFLDFCTYTDGPGYKWSTLSTNGLGDE